MSLNTVYSVQPVLNILSLIFSREAPKEEAVEAMDADESTIPKSSSNGSFKKRKFNE
jgi:hypothetical protein